MESSGTTLSHKRALSQRGVHARIAAMLGAVSLVVVGVLAWALMRWVDTLLAGRPIDDYERAHTIIKLGAAFVLAMIQLMLWLVSRYVARRVTIPAAELAEATERVAAGDLSVFQGDAEADDELGRLSRAAEGMVLELRRLVLAIREAAAETAAMSSEITSGSEQMSAAASQMAGTSGELSEQAGDMARAIAESAVDAAVLMKNATHLSSGAREGVERNAKLRELAAANRERLDASSAAIESVAAEAASSAERAEALAAASQEFGAFITLVRRIARQSKLLALNASMEAARAGAQGEGFAVVAAEIRKLSQSSAEAADRTEETVQEVLARIEDSRAASQRTRLSLDAVSHATQAAFESFAQVERAVLDAEGWTAQIERTATESTDLIVQATLRLDDLARGTENFAAAMQQVAAASEQQSASTQEIAGASATLAEASRKLVGLVQSFRLSDGAPRKRSTAEIPAEAEHTGPAGTTEMPVVPSALAPT